MPLALVGVEQLSVDMYPARAEGVACSCGCICGSADDDAPPPPPEEDAAWGIGLTLLFRPPPPKGNSGSISGLTELSMAREESEGDAEDMPVAGGDSPIIDASLDGSR